MVRWCLAFLVSLIWVSAGSTQGHQDTWNGVGYFLEMDQLDQMYTLDRQSQLIKLSPQGDTLGIFYNQRWGKPTNIDILNPQKILLYYRETNQAVILDQTLSSERHENLETIGQWQAGTIGWTREQGLWIYSQVQQKLIKTGPDGNELASTDPLYYFINDADFSPQRVVECRNIVILSDPRIGWMRFDLFGQYIDFIPQPHSWFTMDRATDTIIYLQEGTIYSWSPGRAFPRPHATEVTSRAKLQQWMQEQCR